MSAQAWAYASVCKRVPFHSRLGIHEQMGAGVYSEIPRTCRALVLCLQAKSSCCWSGVSCLCHDRKLIFYQLPYPTGKGRNGCRAWDEGMSERRREAGVNNPGLWGKVKKPRPCWILSVIPEGSSSLCTHPVLINLTELRAMVAVITSVCQCIQVCLSVTITDSMTAIHPVDGHVPY